MIVEITQFEVEEITNYVFQLNQQKKYQCRPFNQDYTLEVIQEKYLELIENDKDTVLALYGDNNEILGVLGLFIEPEEKYIQSMGGIYAHNNYQEVSKVMIDYLKKEYKGYKSHFGFPIENIDGIESMIINGFHQIENAIIFENNDISKIESDDTNIVLSKDLNINDIIDFYNNNQGDVYWTIDKILLNESKWIMRNYVIDGEIIGSIYIFIYDHLNAEVFGILNKNGFSKPIIKSLLAAGINECLEMELVNILVFADAQEIIESCEEIGLIEIDTHLTFEIIL